MKILAIRLNNLASLAGTHQLDFTTEPLASAGLIAITGPTGAGKSTLLDALCLALFGRVPRLPNSNTTKVPDGTDTLSVNDERTLLRRGCASGYAEVDFIGVDGLPYRARWEVRRARDKASGRLQASQHSLLALSTQTQLARTKNEFHEHLEQKLGLTMAQFTRAVLLAQSEFSAFLKAKDDERGSLLEKLTDTGLYSQLGQRAYQHTKRAEDDLKQLTQQLDGQQPLDEAQRQQLEQNLQQLQHHRQEHQQHLKALEQQHQWLITQERLQQHEQHAQQALTEAQQQTQAHHERRQQLQQLEWAEAVRSDVEQLTQWPHEYQHRHAQQHQLQEQLQQLNAALIQNFAQQQTAQADLEHAEHHQQTAYVSLRQAQRLEDTLQRLQAEQQQRQQQIAQHQQAMAQQAADLNAQQQAIAPLEYQHNQLQSRLQHSQTLNALSDHWQHQQTNLHQLLVSAQNRQALLAQSAERQHALTQAEDQRQQIQQQRQTDSAMAVAPSVGGIAQLSQQLGQYHQQLREAERLHQYEQQRLNLQAEQYQLASEQSHRPAQRQQLEQQRAELQRQLLPAAEDLAQLQHAVTRHQLAHSHSAEALRAQLQSGYACPVCGSLEHPWQSNTTLQQPADEPALEQARQSLENLKHQQHTLNDQYSRFLAHDEALSQQAIRLQQQQLIQALQQAAGYAELHQHPESERLPYLTRHLEELKRRILATQQQLEQQQHQHATDIALREAEYQYQQAQQQLEQYHQQLNLQTQHVIQGLTALGESLTETQRQHWLIQPERSYHALQQAVEQRIQDQQQYTQIATQLQSQYEQLKQLHQQQHQQQQQLTEYQQQDQQSTQQIQQLQTELQHYLGSYPSAQHWETALQQAVTQARTALQHQQTQYHQLQRQHDELLHHLNGQIEQLQQRQHAQQQWHHHLNQWLKQHPEVDEQRLQQLLSLNPQEIQAWQQAIQHADHQQLACQTRLDERRQQRVQHQAHPPSQQLEPQALNEQWAYHRQAAAEAEHHHIQWASRLEEDNRCRARCGALVQQIEAARTEYQRWARLSELIGSADGAAFRKIAQAYNLDLLVQHANVQLRQLAKRYRLQRGGSSLGLLVVDTEMGDECRSVHSLSGGESFLVSLALALGLASMASRTLHIESLFIDEGFGSLDPESLQIALDALDTLQAQGRKVAVISHVQALHERITVQIQVQPQGNGQSQLQIV